MSALPDAVRAHPAVPGLAGEVRPPGDKSVSHRALLLGALARGPVEITGLADAADVRATTACLRRMGATVEVADDGAVVDGTLGEPVDVLDCGNAGTGLRLLAGLAAGTDAHTVLTGDASLRSRPMGRIAEPLRRMGATIDGRDGGRLAPLAVRGPVTTGGLHRLEVASAQVKSAVLLAALTAGVDVEVVEPAASRDHTERMLARLGADVDHRPGRVRLGPGRPDGGRLAVPGDLSGAAFWLVAGCLAASGPLTVRGVGTNPTRAGVLEVLERMGARIERHAETDVAGEPVADLVVERGPLAAAVVDGDLSVRAIDELPVLAVAGAAGGGLEVRDAGELAVKESDRIRGVAAMLGALGGTVDTRPDGFVVHPAQLHGGRVDARGDHRLAMAAVVAAQVADGPVDVDGFASVATSYPTFLDDLGALGGLWEVPG